MAVQTRPDGASQPPTRQRQTRDLEQLHSQMGRMLENTIPGFGDLGMVIGGWSPLVDIEEADDAWVIEAELPGVKRGDVNVELRQGELSITGEVKRRERKGILRRQTRPVGRFEYRVTLPGEVDADAIEAKLDDGVLTVRVPKPQRAQARRIEVKGK
jgi:HSP20 family protein